MIQVKTSKYTLDDLMEYLVNLTILLRNSQEDLHILIKNLDVRIEELKGLTQVSKVNEVDLF